LKEELQNLDEEMEQKLGPIEQEIDLREEMATLEQDVNSRLGRFEEENVS